MLRRFCHRCVSDFRPLGGNRQDCAIVSCAAIYLHDSCPPDGRNDVHCCALPGDVLDVSLAILCAPPIVVSQDDINLRWPVRPDFLRWPVRSSTGRSAPDRISFAARLRTTDRFTRSGLGHLLHEYSDATITVDTLWVAIPPSSETENEAGHSATPRFSATWTNITRIDAWGNISSQSDDKFFNDLFDITKLTRLDLRCTNLPVIGDHFLLKCERLTSAKLPDCLMVIGNFFMSGADLMTTIDLRNCSALRRIGKNFLNKLTKLTSVQLPTSLTEVGSYCFTGCSILTQIHLDNTSLTAVGSHFLCECPCLTTIKLPDCLAAAGDSFLSKCAALQEVNISNTTLTNMPCGAFRSCSSLTSVTLPQCLRVISNDFLRGCNTLQHIDFSATVLENVGHGFLSDCARLTNLALPPSLRQVTGRFMANCVSVTEIDLQHTSLERVGHCFLLNCKNLTTLKFPSSFAKPLTDFMSCSLPQKDPESLMFHNIGVLFLCNCTRLSSATLHGSLQTPNLSIANFLTQCSQLAEIHQQTYPALMSSDD